MEHLFELVLEAYNPENDTAVTIAKREIIHESIIHYVAKTDTLEQEDKTLFSKFIKHLREIEKLEELRELPSFNQDFIDSCLEGLSSLQMSDKVAKLLSEIEQDKAFEAEISNPFDDGMDYRDC